MIGTEAVPTDAEAEPRLLPSTSACNSLDDIHL